MCGCISLLQQWAHKCAINRILHDRIAAPSVRPFASESFALCMLCLVPRPSLSPRLLPPNSLVPCCRPYLREPIPQKNPYHYTFADAASVMVQLPCKAHIPLANGRYRKLGWVVRKASVRGTRQAQVTTSGRPRAKLRALVALSVPRTLTCASPLGLRCREDRRLMAVMKTCCDLTKNVTSWPT